MPIDLRQDQRLKKICSYTESSVLFELKKWRDHLEASQKNPRYWAIQKFGFDGIKAKIAELEGDVNKSVLVDGTVPTGLVPRICSEFGYQPVSEISYSEPRPMPWHEKPRFDLRPYQEAAVESLLKARHGAVSLATGTGKTRIAMELVKRIGLKTIIATPFTNIAEQIYDEFRRHLGPHKVGKFWGGKKESKKQVVIAVNRSLSLLEPGHVYDDIKKSDVFISDECFTARMTVVSKEYGVKPLSMIVSKVLAGNPVSVLSYNVNSQKTEFKTVLAARSKPMPESMRRIEFLKGVILCTHNHPFLLLSGEWKRSEDLKPGDVVIGRNGSNQKIGSGLLIPNEDQRSMILGGMLGDGSAAKSTSSCKVNAFRIRFNHSIAQKDYLSWKACLLQAKVTTFLSKGFKKDGEMCRTQSRMFYDPIDFSDRDMAVREIKITPKILSCWFADDSSSQKKENAACLHTEGFSYETIDILCQKLMSEFGLTVKPKTVKKKDKEYRVIYINSDSFYRLSEIVAPYTHPSMSYKIHSDFRHLCGSYEWDNRWGEMRAYIVKRSESYTPEFWSNARDFEKRVYDLEVAENHNFIVGCTNSGSGVVAHNCHMLPAQTLQKTCEGVLADIPYRFFLSGTQIRGDGKDIVLAGITGPIVAELDVKTAVDQGYLTKPRFLQVSIDSAIRESRMDDPIASNRKHLQLNPGVYVRLGHMLKSAMSKGRRAVVFIDQLEQFSLLEPYLQGLRVGFAHGGATPKNRGSIDPRYWKSDPLDLVAKFDNKEIDVLVGTSVIGTGTDIKSASVLFDLVGLASEVRIRQNVGRGTRLHPDKQDFWYVDFDIRNVRILNNQAKARAKIFEDIYGPVVMK